MLTRVWVGFTVFLVIPGDDRESSKPWVPVQAGDDGACWVPVQAGGDGVGASPVKPGATGFVRHRLDLSVQ